MAYTQKTIGEFTLATSIGDTDLIPIEQAGVTKRIPFSLVKTTVPNLGYITNTFENSDLSGGVLTINHAKNSLLVRLMVVDPLGIVQSYPYDIVDANNVTINFGGDIDSGTWTYWLEYWGGVGAGYPDPTYEPALTRTNPTLNTATKNAALTIIDSVFRRMGNIIVCSLRITSSSQFLESGSGAIVGVLNVIPLTDFFFPGAIVKVAFYESAWGYIRTDGEIRIYCGKAGETYIFNFIFSTI